MKRLMISLAMLVLIPGFAPTPTLANAPTVAKLNPCNRSKYFPTPTEHHMAYACSYHARKHRHIGNTAENR